MNFEDYKEELRAIELTYGMTAYMGMSVKRVYRSSLERYWDLYQIEQNADFLILATLIIRAYLQHGYVYAEEKEFFDLILAAANVTYEQVKPLRIHNGIKVSKLTKERIHSMIQRWPSSKSRTHTIGELVAEIFEKIKQHEEGRYIYVNESGTNAARNEVYELIIAKEESYLHDAKRGIYHQFIWEEQLEDEDSCSR